MLKFYQKSKCQEIVKTTPCFDNVTEEGAIFDTFLKFSFLTPKVP
jgi:hypothetical protein